MVVERGNMAKTGRKMSHVTNGTMGNAIKKKKIVEGSMSVINA